jgi:hypothetical protein
MGMKNQILALFAILALFGLTATGAQAHTHGGGHGGSHGGHGFAHNHGYGRHHHEFRNGQWYDWDDDDDASVLIPGFSINLNL